MGLPWAPQDAAPAYDDVIHTHPVNQAPPLGRPSAYAAVPQDDIELNAHNHGESSSSATPTQQPESLAQTIAGVFKPKPHVHCEQCDVQLAARERRANERHCCAMVALTFVSAFFCTMILGIVVASKMAKMKKEH